MKINEISPQNNEFLQVLGSIANPPKRLYYLGTPPTIRRPSLAVVGTRKPTAYGREITTRFAEETASQGVAIVSGLALGVDALAHQAALSAGGLTVAVLGSGLAELYPATNKRLAADIVASGGAIFSEYEPHEKARSHYFLERNRIVSGLADAILITEAAVRSGTMSTAAHALEQGKEVFVVPGNITSPMSVGCNQLIKQGATPVTHPSEIFDFLLPGRITEQAVLPLGNTPLETAVIKHIAAGVRDGEELQRKTSESATNLSMALTMLELNGIIRSLGANQWTLR